MARMKNVRPPEGVRGRTWMRGGRQTVSNLTTMTNQTCNMYAVYSTILYTEYTL